MVGFLDRLGRGWTLTKTSFKIIREEKQLLILPVISGITLALVVMSFLAGFLGIVLWGSLFSNMDGTVATILLIVLGFLFYVVTYFVGIYFNAALIHCATIKLQGGKPTLGDGFKAANQAIGKLFSWAVVAATVGMIIQAIQSRGGIIGKVVGTIAGIAWSIAIYFAVPVILYERLSPFKAVHRSVEIMRKTWGEAMGGTFGMGIIFALLALAGLVPIFAGLMLWSVIGIYGVLAFIIITRAAGRPLQVCGDRRGLAGLRPGCLRKPLEPGGDLAGAAPVQAELLKMRGLGFGYRGSGFGSRRLLSSRTPNTKNRTPIPITRTLRHPQ
jgi:hypothetical protein